MTEYVGLDVSMKETKLHVLDEAGKRVWRGRCASEPEAIAATLRKHAPAAAAIGLERGRSRLGSAPSSRRWASR